MSRKRNILKVIACGYEHGGTTVLSQLLASHPALETGFESGLLLASKPRQFLDPSHAPYNQSLIRNGWGITDADLRFITDTRSWVEVYHRLRERSSVVLDKNSDLIDKTPRYMLHLKDVLKRMKKVPCVVIVKQPRGVIWSWLKRAPGVNIENIQHETVEELCQRYELYARGFATARKAWPRRILKTGYEDLCREPVREAERIFDFLGLDFDPSFTRLENRYKVHGNRISSDYIDEYEGKLAPEFIEIIDRNTRNAIDLLNGN